MKVIVFNDDKEVLSVMEDITEPIAYSESEVRWQGGGAGGIENNYIIVEDGVRLEDLTDQEIYEQLQLQRKLQIAREYEEGRIEALATDTEAEQEAAFLEAREKMNGAKDKEQLVYINNEYKNKARNIRAAAKKRIDNNTTE